MGEGTDIAVGRGGPQTFTRRAQLELACTLAGRDPRIVKVPPRVVRGGVALLRPVDARRAQVIRFLAAICTIDMVGPPTGQRQLADYLVAAVGGSG